MPLDTSIVRDGKPLKLRWGGFHVAAMVYAVSIDSGVSPFTDIEVVRASAKQLMEEQGEIGITPKDAFELTDYGVIGATPLNSADYTMKEWTLTFIDITDGERFTIKPGDVLSMSRSMR
jgi:hypothetical protein